MLGRERPDHAEGGQVDALDLQAGALDGGGGALDHLAADGHDDDARAQAESACCTTPSGWKSSTASSIGIGMWSGAAARTAASSSFGSSTTAGEVERAHDDALVGDAQAHALGQLVLGEERLERLRQGDRIGDLAVAHDAGPKLGDSAAGQGDGAIGAHLGGGHVAGVELEADDAGVERNASCGTRSCASAYRRAPLEGVETPGVKRSEAGPRARFAEERSAVSWGLPGAGGRAAALLVGGQVRVTVPAVFVIDVDGAVGPST